MKNQHDILVQFHRLLASPTENEVIEFKEAKNTFPFEEIGEYFSALANEANLRGEAAAWLVFGVSNKREIVGTRFRPQAKDLHSLKLERFTKELRERLKMIFIKSICCFS